MPDNLAQGTDLSIVLSSQQVLGLRRNCWAWHGHTHDLPKFPTLFLQVLDHLQTASREQATLACQCHLVIYSYRSFPMWFP